MVRTAEDVERGMMNMMAQLSMQNQKGLTPWGNGGKIGWKGNGKGGNKGRGKDGGKGLNPNTLQPCIGCGGMHHRSHCPAKINQTICQQCYKPGHLKSHCRSIPVDDSTICKCCGEKGHTRKIVPKTQIHAKDARCGVTQTRCAHTQTGICTQGEASLEAAATFSPSGNEKAGIWRSTSFRTVWAGQRPRIQMDMRKLWWARHRRRRQCNQMPRMLSCKREENGKRHSSSVLQKCATQNESNLRTNLSEGCRNGKHDGTAAAHEGISRKNSEAGRRHNKSGESRRTDIQTIVDKKKQELKALQPKLPQPTQHLKDHGDVVSALRELEEKRKRENQRARRQEEKGSGKKNNKSEPTRKHRRKQSGKRW